MISNYSDDNKPALTEFQQARLERIAQKMDVNLLSPEARGFLMALIRGDAWQKVA